MTQTDDDQTSREIIAEGAVPDVEWTASAMLVVKRGPNTGSRFPLHQAVTSAGRDPRQRHLPRRRDRQPAPRRIPVGTR